MEGLIYLSIAVGGMGVLCGVIYPLCAIIYYPIYWINGGNETFKEYLSNL